MSPRESLDHLLAHLGRQIGIEGLSLDENGACTLSLDGSLAVVVLHHPLNERVNLAARLGSLQPERLLDQYRAMLQANPFGRDVGEAVLGVADDGVTALLTQEFSADGMEGIDFVSTIEAFIARCSAWQARLNSEVPRQEVSAAAGDVPEFAVRI